jgi:amino acid transporter
MIKNLKRFLVGSPIRSAMAHHERLSKKTAMAVFSSDAISSVAYSNEAILLVLVAAGTAATVNLVPIVIGITVLLGILTLSYRQTIHAYPSGGGAYIVAKDNIGTQAGLVAGASLLVDYILTVAVSVSSGVAAITSAFQNTRLEFLAEHRVPICLIFISIIAIINLRGVRESGAIFAGPTYLFIFSMLALIVVGFIKYYTTGSTIPPPEHHYFDESVGNLKNHALSGWVLIWLIMRAFASGCTALTGVEAISNGIPAFKKPESDNAATTLTWMAVVMGTIILGTGFLAYKLQALPIGPEETLVSSMARHTFGSGIFYYIIQAATAAILVLAANTSFADFPRLASLLAADRFLPRQFANRGDRLVFSNGVVFLALFAGGLVWLFGGNEQKMLPLYAVGVFLSFTLSQSGMVIHWLRERKGHDVGDSLHRGQHAAKTLQSGEVKAGEFSPESSLSGASAVRSKRIVPIAVNLTGAIITGIVTIVIASTKFMHGAWAVILLIPLLVVMFRSIHNHYLEVAKQLSTEGLSGLRPIKHEVLVPISGLHRGVITALEYAKSIAPGHVTAVYVDLDDTATRRLRERWDKWGTGVNLVVLASPYRSIVRPLMRYIDRVEQRADDDIVTVVLPEFVTARWWQHFLHNQNSLLLKGALLFKRGIVVISVPYHLEH